MEQNSDAKSKKDVVQFLTDEKGKINGFFLKGRPATIFVAGIAVFLTVCLLLGGALMVVPLK